MVAGAVVHDDGQGAVVFEGELGTDDGLDTELFGFVMGAGGAVEAVAVGEGEVGVAEFSGAGDEVLWGGCSVEEAEGAAGVELGEHGFFASKGW